MQLIAKLFHKKYKQRDRYTWRSLIADYMTKNDTEPVIKLSLKV